MIFIEFIEPGAMLYLHALMALRLEVYHQLLEVALLMPPVLPSVLLPDLLEGAASGAAPLPEGGLPPRRLPPGPPKGDRPRS